MCSTYSVYDVWQLLCVYVCVLYAECRQAEVRLSSAEQNWTNQNISNVQPSLLHIRLSPCIAFHDPRPSSPYLLPHPLPHPVGTLVSHGQAVSLQLAVSLTLTVEMKRVLLSPYQLTRSDHPSIHPSIHFFIHWFFQFYHFTITVLCSLHFMLKMFGFILTIALS